MKGLTSGTAPEQEGSVLVGGLLSEASSQIIHGSVGGLTGLQESTEAPFIFSDESCL